MMTHDSGGLQAHPAPEPAEIYVGSMTVRELYITRVFVCGTEDSICVMSSMAEALLLAEEEAPRVTREITFEFPAEGMAVGNRIRAEREVREWRERRDAGSR